MNYLVILTFHRVSSDYDSRIHQRNLWTKAEVFEKQIIKLQKRYRIVPLYQALADIESGTLEGRCVAITVDDGDISLEMAIAPILKRRRCPATVFINTACFDCKFLHFTFLVRYLANSKESRLKGLVTDDLIRKTDRMRTTKNPQEYAALRAEIEPLSEFIQNKNRLFVTESFLGNLDSSLITVGLHGHEHQRFSMMTADWQREAIEKNIRLLKHLPAYRPVFAAPFGRPLDWNAETVRICLENGLFFLSSSGGINLTKQIVYQRIPVDGYDACRRIAEEITGIRDKINLKELYRHKSSS